LAKSASDEFVRGGTLLKPRRAAPIAIARLLIAGLTQLDQVDGHQNHMKEENRIDVGQQPVEDKQNIACQRQPSKRLDRSHAEACQYGECRGETEQIQPAQRRSP
jgi:hypothetical protein